MSEQNTGNGTSGEERDERTAGDGGSERARNARERMSDGLNRGLGVLSAFKEALEQTISEARERGDLSVDRARDAMKEALGRAREATSDAREKFDFVTQAEFDDLARRVRELERRFGETRSEGDATGEP